MAGFNPRERPLLMIGVVAGLFVVLGVVLVLAYNNDVLALKDTGTVMMVVGGVVVGLLFVFILWKMSRGDDFE